METIAINYWAILVGGVFSMVLGAIWYGPIFGNKWMEIVGMNPKDTVAMEKMKKSAGPMYLVQFILTLFQVLVLAHLIADTQTVGGVERALWIWAAFIMPTLAGAVMWTNEPKHLKWSRFFIQGGYQLILFIAFGLLLHFWK